MLVTLYYLAPIQDLQSVHVAVSLSVAVVILVVVIVLQVQAIARSRYPALRAVEALALTGPLFLVMYATAYVVLAQDSAANFNTHMLSRTDSLYFTLTVFSTVGFGDITATSQSARAFVMVQMALDLVILGLGVQAYRGAVSVGRQRSVAVPGSQPGGKNPPDQAKGNQP